MVIVTLVDPAIREAKYMGRDLMTGPPKSDDLFIMMRVRRRLCQ